MRLRSKAIGLNAKCERQQRREVRRGGTWDKSPKLLGTHKTTWTLVPVVEQLKYALVHSHMQMFAYTCIII